MAPRLINRTPLVLATVVSFLDRPGATLTVVVKGTVDLVPGGVARLAAQQTPPSGDEPLPPLADPPPGQDAAVSLRHGSDLVPFKPAADVTLIGTAHAPGGIAVLALEVELGVGTWRKRVAVIGDRAWCGRQPGDPHPFTRLPLRWEFAYGGPGFADNPVGRGHGDDRLPNLERPGELITGKRSAPLPAGFGPLPIDHPHRRRHLGKARRDHLVTAWPGFPAGFDPAFFNSAPLDQQVPGWLRGDEPILIRNAHPTHALIETTLPGLEPRLALRHADGDTDEVTLRLDTLAIDAGSLTAELVWRARIAVADDALTGIAGLYLACDEPGTRCSRDAFIAACALAFTPAELDPVSAGIAARAAAALGEQRALDEAQAAIPALPAESGRWTRPRVDAAVAEGGALAGVDLSGLDLTGLVAPGISLRGALLRGAILRGARLAGADLSEALLAGADCAGAGLAGALLVGADATAADLSRTDLTGADLSGAVLCGANLTGAACAGCRGTAADLSGIQAAESDWTGASLPGALLTAARLDRAVFAGADLSAADLSRAVAVDADFTRATLANLRASPGADFSRALLRQVTAPDAVFSQCRLDGADLSLSRLPAGQFVGVSAVGATFLGCALGRACFIGADLAGAVFDRADLRQGSLEKAHLGRASLRDANLFETDVRDADRTGADLAGTVLERR